MPLDRYLVEESPRSDVVHVEVVLPWRFFCGGRPTVAHQTALVWGDHDVLELLTDQVIMRNLVSSCTWKGYSKFHWLTPSGTARDLTGRLALFDCLTDRAGVKKPYQSKLGFMFMYGPARPLLRTYLYITQ